MSVHRISGGVYGCESVHRISGGGIGHVRVHPASLALWLVDAAARLNRQTNKQTSLLIFLDPVSCCPLTPPRLPQGNTTGLQFTLPVFAEGTVGDTFGSNYSLSPACTPDLCFNSSSGMAFWGFVIGVTDLESSMVGTDSWYVVD